MPTEIAQVSVACAVLCFVGWTALRVRRWFFERRYGRDDDPA